MAYQNDRAGLTENQQLLLLAIASESLVSSPLSQQFISTHHLPATSSVKTALKALVDKQLVSKTPKWLFGKRPLLCEVAGERGNHIIVLPSFCWHI